MNEVYEIAEAVKADLIDAVLAEELTPRFAPLRVYLPTEDLIALDTLTVLVVPKTDDLSVLSRDEMLSNIAIDVGIMKHLPPNVDPTTAEANATIDPLVKLARSMALIYGPGDKAADAVWISSKCSLLYDTDSLKIDRLFMAIVTFNFKQG